MKKNAARIIALRNQIADLKKRLPHHSISPAMLLELEELQGELEKELEKPDQVLHSYGEREL